MKKTPTDVARLRRAVADAPADLYLRLILADAMEEAGAQAEADVQRLLIPFVRMVDDAIHEGYGAEATDGPRWIRVYTYRVASDQRSSYAWVRKADGAVFRGSWKRAEEPVRFHLSDGPDVWEGHITPYGLAYMSNVTH
jgi:uncharacterized protein (TIGR02996 family)